MNGNEILIGMVQSGQFKPLTPKAIGGSVRLTTIPMQAAQSPESAEVHLTEYEGKAIAVQGHAGGGWIYSASVIDNAGPIVTVLVQSVFGE